MNFLDWHHARTYVGLQQMQLLCLAYALTRLRAEYREYVLHAEQSVLLFCAADMASYRNVQDAMHTICIFDTLSYFLASGILRAVIGIVGEWHPSSLFGQ